MPAHSDADAALARALPPILDDLEATNAWMKDLNTEFRDAAHRREKLVAAADRLIQTVDKPTRDRFVRRYAAATAKPSVKSRRNNTLTHKVLTFLIDQEHEHVRAAELTWYMKRMGYRIDGRYGANALGHLAASGHVTRTGHGIYRINRYHPELLAIQLELLQKEKRRVLG